MNTDAKVVKTNDGSHTIYLPKLNEHYHSIHGSRLESEHVYIKMGIDAFLSDNNNVKQIRVLEVGFGTGLNALLTYNYAIRNKIKINYITLEPHVLDFELIEKLKFNFINDEKNNFQNLHKLEWNKDFEINEYFTIKKVNQKLEDFEVRNCKFDVIYFDAFAPNKQKNIWSSGNFLKLKTVLNNEAGIITTYCAQGEFMRTAKKVGFQVVEKEGPPGKRIMTQLKNE